MKLRMPAEWEPQDAILLAFPHENTDWKPLLKEVEPVYLEIISYLVKYENVILLVDNLKKVKGKLAKKKIPRDKVRFYEIPTNDTWARDFGPITVTRKGKPQLLDFGFNGWGLKFPADKDNQINQLLYGQEAFGDRKPKTMGMILEGGSIESDGAGTILTTSECLLSPNRNPQFTKEKWNKKLKKYLGAKQVHWLEHGYLEGDDTDSHIDTLARFCPGDRIVYVECDDPSDSHYEAFCKMKEQLMTFRNIDNQPYELIALPWAKAVYDQAGDRLPATYANFLIVNQGVLVPTYEDEVRDKKARQILKEVFPGREVIGINCLPLIYQHGSLHCITMQLPKGVW